MEHKKPTISDKAINLTKSAINWAKIDGFTTVSSETFHQRKSICLSCENWDPTGFSNKGNCKICGCSVAKLYIPSAKCPLIPPKWKESS